MKKLTILITLLTYVLAINAIPAWVVEAEKDGYVTWSKDSVADIHAPGGLTLWHTTPLRGNVIVEYEARIVSDGRVSDLNCFWMASDPSAKDVFTHMKERGGKFVNSYALQLYYVGYGGNHNSTTRFRRYNGDTRGIDNAQYRPAILREYLDTAHMIRGDHWYHIRLEQRDGHARYFIDGECLVDFVDAQPLTEGYFGFRTTLAHAQLRNYRVTSLPSPCPISTTSLFLRRTTPMTFGVPFLQGEHRTGDKLCVTADGKPLQSDQWTLATWPDGSVKWKAVATVIPQSATSFSVTLPTGGKTVSNTARKTRKDTRSTTQAINGTHASPVLHIGTGGNILDSITIDGRRTVGRVWMELNGTMQRVTTATHEQSGTVRDTWRIDGDNFSLRLYTYHGSSEVKIICTPFIDSLTAAHGLRSLALKAEVPLRGMMHQRRIAFLRDSADVFRMDVKPLICRRPITLDDNAMPRNDRDARLLQSLASWDGFRLSQLSPNAFSIRKRATGASPYIGTIEGHRAPGLMAIGDNTASVAFHLNDFWQSYPSTLQVDNARSDNATATLFLWSPEAEPMSFEHYDTVAHTLEAAYEDVQPGMSTAVGTARTTTLYLYPALTPIDSLAPLLPAYADHRPLLPSPQYLHAKRAFGYWSLDEGTATDTLLTHLMDYYHKETDRHAWYGYFNYGDVMHSYDVSRDEWRYDVGGYAWDNTELGTPAMLWYQYLRTGNLVTYRMAEAMTRHCSEVDCYHRGPHAGLGTRHNVLHWGCGAKEARISEAFWNRFLYYLTADERMGDLMHEVADADQLLYSLDPMRLAQPRSAKHPCTAPARLRIGPDWLAYAGNWFTEWERTGNTAYRDKILAGMQSISSLPQGIFSGPKALGYDPATGIITWEGDSAVSNTNHLATIMGGFEMMNEMMLSINTPQWQRTWLHHAAEYRQRTLSHGGAFMVPRLSAYAWWHTGKEEQRTNAIHDHQRNHPFKMLLGAPSVNTLPMSPRGGFYTNDAATFTLDAIFMQEVMR